MKRLFPAPSVALTVLLLTLTSSTRLHAETPPPGAETAAKQLRSQIDASVKAYFSSRRPAPSPIPSSDECIKEVIDREIQVSSSGTIDRPQTVVQFLKKKKQAGKGRDRAAALQEAMKTANAQTQRELALSILNEMKSGSFNRVKQDLLWRSAITENTNTAALDLLDAKTMNQLIQDYWWADARLKALN